MTFVEGVVGLIASVIAIIGALILVARYLARRFDKWTEAVIENSTVMRNLAARVTRLEGAIKNNGN